MFFEVLANGPKQILGALDSVSGSNSFYGFDRDMGVVDSPG
ncbi:MAG TPA: hypothetical protein VFU86_21880 [Terriglobales bacterium]|nr:hypothetical protein [Terriglobales bacterium]